MTKTTKKRLPPLPSLLDRKIYKTGQTRGADDDEIFQNRVSRNGTVLIPFSVVKQVFSSLPKGESFEKGFIVLISPKQFFNNSETKQQLIELGLKLAENLLIFYELREDWNLYSPDKYDYQPATSRNNPLGGHYVARIPATTAAESGHKIALGFHTTKPKGAGIRFYEYASEKMTADCRVQLETLFWLCYDSNEVAISNGMKENDVEFRKASVLALATSNGLLDYEKLIQSRIINKSHQSICPLCLERLSAAGFFNKMEQAEGREVSDLTITQLNLFHINELRLGELNHTTYNLGWGHHHCNVVVKDAGIIPTLNWMAEVIERNKTEGHL
jgi:hypothetical protein